MLDDGIVVKFIGPWGRMPWVLRGSSEAESFRAIKMDICAYFPFWCSLNTLQHRLFSLLGFRSLAGFGRGTSFRLSWKQDKKGKKFQETYGNISANWSTMCNSNTSRYSHN